jgi:hypothetical protein
VRARLRRAPGPSGSSAAGRAAVQCTARRPGDLLLLLLLWWPQLREAFPQLLLLLWVMSLLLVLLLLLLSHLLHSWGRLLQWLLTWRLLPGRRYPPGTALQRRQQRRVRALPHSSSKNRQDLPSRSCR